MIINKTFFEKNNKKRGSLLFVALFTFSVTFLINTRIISYIYTSLNIMKMRKKIITFPYSIRYSIGADSEQKMGKVVDRWKFLIRARMKVSWGFSVKESVTNGGTGNGTGVSRCSAFDSRIGEPASRSI